MKPFNDLRRKLIHSINNSRQASTFLMANGDCMTDRCLVIDQTLAHASREAFLPVKKRDLFCLGFPNDTLFRARIPPIRVSSFQTEALRPQTYNPS